MSGNATYSSKNILNKAIFNIAFQIVPIAAALILTPFLINNMGKDLWAKFATGVSIIFLSNYFSFGIGPTLNRRVAEIIGLNENQRIGKELKECTALSVVLGVVFFIILQLLLYFSYTSNAFSILKSETDFQFYLIILLVFVMAFAIIPYKSLLESFSDFYFLAIARAFAASMLFIIPAMFIVFEEISLVFIAVALAIFYIFLYAAYYLRVLGHQHKFSFKLISPYSLGFLKSIFKINSGFLKETFFFSLFFLTSAIVLFFDRFYYPIFFDTKIISDQVTMLDLFNRIAIVTGTISLVYFSAISVWFNEGKLNKIKTNLKRQLVMVGVVFLLIILISYFFLGDILHWWLGESYSKFIENNSLFLLLGVLSVNFTILLIRPLQAIGEIKTVSLFLVMSTIVYLCIVIVLGINRSIELHFAALFTKAFFDIVIFTYLLKRKHLLW
ncbi:MAG: hypothetical protein KJN85_09225 [Maribacter sp.]|nr:hypothetical protein [Maribacter sp.]MBT8313296.1 hypothetical protein [Maribacter sp.]